MQKVPAQGGPFSRNPNYSKNLVLKSLIESSNEKSLTQKSFHAVIIHIQSTF